MSLKSVSKDEKVKYSTLSVNDCKKHLNIENDFVEDDTFIEICLNYAKDYVKNYTSLTEEQLDQLPSIVIAVLLIASDAYNRRALAFGYDNNKVNFILKSILDMHRKWL